MRKHALILFVLTLVTTALYAAAPLTNAEVVKLSKVGIGDDAIVAKIRQAEEVDFKTETDDLIALKKDGVSGKVIAAMIDRQSAGVGGVTLAPGVVAGGPASKVKLVTEEGATPIASLLGESSSTYVYVTMLFWENFPGLHANVRTTEKNPGFLIASDRDPRSRFFVVRLDVNDKDGDRSLKMGKSGAFSFKAGTSPDSDWTFPFDAVEEKKGSWKISLKKPLVAGEYGVYEVQAQELYDFGVD